jgi:hypothetical protein
MIDRSTDAHEHIRLGSTQGTTWWPLASSLQPGSGQRGSELIRGHEGSISEQPLTEVGADGRPKRRIAEGFGLIFFSSSESSL